MPKPMIASLLEQSIDPLDRALEDKLIVLAQRGDSAAREYVLRSNLRYLVKYVVEHERFWYSIGRDEAISAALGAMDKAIDTYDRDKCKTKFCGWAGRQMGWAMLRVSKHIGGPVRGSKTKKACIPEAAPLEDTLAVCSYQPEEVSGDYIGFMRTVLTAWQYTVICHKFGLDGHEQLLPHEIADRYDVGVNGVHDAYARAKHKLQQHREEFGYAKF